MDQPSILKIQDVIERTKMGRTLIYQRIKEGTFPAQIKLGKRAVGWRSIDIDNFILNLTSEQTQTKTQPKTQTQTPNTPQSSATVQKVNPRFRGRTITTRSEVR